MTSGIPTNHNHPLVPDVIDGDMTGDDIVFVLDHLHFSHGLRTITLDKDARDYLVAAVRERSGKA
jgi:hypothetical protein